MINYKWIGAWPGYEAKMVEATRSGDKLRMMAITKAKIAALNTETFPYTAMHTEIFDNEEELDRATMKPYGLDHEVLPLYEMPEEKGLLPILVHARKVVTELPLDWTKWATLVVTVLYTKGVARCVFCVAPKDGAFFIPCTYISKIEEAVFANVAAFQ